MDGISATRNDAALTAQLSGSTALPAVSGNGKATDPLQPRPAAQPGANAAAGDSDNAEVRPGNDRGLNHEYTTEEQTRLRDLRARDRQVRAHEQAHLSAAGQHAQGGASFTFASGPDGRRYAVGGEVSIDSAAVPGDPRATLAKAQQIQRAALAPADPSPQDRQVAAQAAAMSRKASAELTQQRLQTTQDQGSELTRAYSAPNQAETLINLVA